MDYRGDGRSRTAVQTTSPAAFYTLILPLVVGCGLPDPAAFYTLILPLVVGCGLPEGGPDATYPLSLGRF